jgi:DNA-binding transcriptional regulator/RsmH inhibitor MraZ
VNFLKWMNGKEDQPEIMHFVTTLDGREVVVIPEARWQELRVELQDRADTAADDEERALYVSTLTVASHYGIETSVKNGRLQVPAELRRDLNYENVAVVFRSERDFIVLARGPEYKSDLEVAKKNLPVDRNKLFARKV